MKIAYFGLPLGALLLARDGHLLGPVVLSPVAAPGRRRLERQQRASGGKRELRGVRELIDALEPGADLEARVDKALSIEAPDALVSWFWTRKLAERWLMAPPLGAIGVHPSLLPRHRGPNPYFWAIDSGDEVTGVTVHRLAAEYDTGSLIDARSLPIAGRDAWQLARALDRPSLALLRETAQRLARGEQLSETPQDESLASWAPEPTGDALRVDFGWTTERVLRRIRALSPTPGLALELNGIRFFVTRAEPAPTYAKALLPGEAQLAPLDSALFLRTGEGAIRVTGAYFPGTGESSSDAAGVARLLSRGARP